jgi:uncharacterized SAM-binding protein YcdF (DUF218 family)
MKTAFSVTFGAVFAAWAIWVAGFVWFASTISDQPEDTDLHTDAIVVLTGGSDRLATGMALLAQGSADKLFVSGVHRGVEVGDMLRASHVSREGLADKITLGKIMLGHDADDTVGNADETARWVRAQGITSLRLVTADYHMRRSLWEFHHTLPDIKIVAHPVQPESVKWKPWWRSWPTTTLLATEYSKYVAARLRSFVRKGDIS